MGAKLRTESRASWVFTWTNNIRLNLEVTLKEFIRRTVWFVSNIPQKDKSIVRAGKILTFQVTPLAEMSYFLQLQQLSNDSLR